MYRTPADRKAEAARYQQMTEQSQDRVAAERKAAELEPEWLKKMLAKHEAKTNDRSSWLAIPMEKVTI